MREIQSIHIGQCGNQIGAKFWEVISEEHGIDPSGNYIGESDYQKQKLEVYYDEIKSNNYSARAVLVDLESGTIDSICRNKHAKLYKPDNFISGKNGASNIWAKGYYKEGYEIIENVLEIVRKEVENCDCLQSFQITHSLGGGTGSGLGSLITERLKEEFKDDLISTFTIFPSPKISDIMLEPYNSTLSIHQLVDNSNSNMVIDNEALYNICNKNLKIKSPTYGDLNHLVANAMSGVSCSTRFPGYNNADTRKMITNLTPFIRLHFYMLGFAPVISRESNDYTNLTIPTLTNQLLIGTNITNTCNPKNGMLMSLSILYRGNNISTGEVEESTLREKNKNTSNFKIGFLIIFKQVYVIFHKKIQIFQER